MTGVLVLALVVAGAGAMLFGGQVKPPAAPDPVAAKPPPSPRPAVPAPTASAKAEIEGPRPTTWEACLGWRASRELEAPSVMEKIAEIFVREVPPEDALKWIGALGDAASKIPDPPSRAAALAGIAEALLDLDAKKEARVSLDLARDAAAKAGISARGGEGLSTLGRIAAGYVRVGEPDLAKELGGESPEVVTAIALAHVRVGDTAKAKPLVDTVRAALEAAPQRLQTRIAMARLHAALGDAAAAGEVAEGSAESERALVHYRVAETLRRAEEGQGSARLARGRPRRARQGAVELAAQGLAPRRGRQGLPLARQARRGRCGRRGGPGPQQGSGGVDVSRADPRAGGDRSRASR
jgi:hypothetical protein